MEPFTKSATVDRWPIEHHDEPEGPIRVTDFNVPARVQHALPGLVQELVAAGAEAIVLVGSHARGEATELSDVDLYVIGTGPTYEVRVVDDLLCSISWRTEEQERQALRRPASVGAAVPGWRTSRILHDPAGIAGALKAEAQAFDWSAIGSECDEWVADQVTGYAEEVLKLVAARRASERQLAAVQRSILALRLPACMAVHHRLLFDSENRLWSTVNQALGERWATAQAAALGLGEPERADEAALTLFTLAVDQPRPLLSPQQHAVVDFALRAIHDRSDPYTPLKDLGWRGIAAIDAQLESGEIDEPGWHAAMADLIVPAYLAAETPWEGSGKQGTAEDWEYSRSHVANAIDHDGSFLDIGCANGYLLECLPHWTPHDVDRYGLDISPELVQLAGHRLPELADRLWVGNALHWQPPHRFAYIRTGLEYVPRYRRRELVERLLGWCDRLIVGVFNEEAHARPTEELLRSWGYRIAGRTERANRGKPGIDYRVLWIDAT